MPVLNLNDNQASLIALALQRLSDTDGEYSRSCSQLMSVIHEARAHEESGAYLREINTMFEPSELAELSDEEHAAYINAMG